MKKILFSLMTLFLVSSLVSASVFAIFSDTETSTGNAFTAGTLDLKVAGADDPIGTKISVTSPPGMKPGDTGSVSIDVTNAGTIDGVADLHVKNLVNYENGQNEPEAAVDSTTGDTEGELGAYLLVTITYDSGTVVTAATLNSLNCQNKILGDLPAGQTKTITISWTLPSETGNEVQSDSVVFDIEFSLNQK